MFGLGIAAVLSATSVLASEPLVLAEEDIRFGRSGHIIIDVEVNGQGPYAFVVDTGAQTSVVFDSLIEELDLEPSDSVTVQGASGPQESYFYNLEELRVDEASVSDVRVVEGPAGLSRGLARFRTYGLLGADLLNAYGVEFDFADNRFVLYDADADFSAVTTGWSRADYELNEVGFATFPVSISGVEAHAILDLGAAHHVINAPSFEALGYSEDDEFDETRRLRGFSGEQVRAPIISDIDLGMGNLRLDDVHVTYMDSAVFRMLGHGDTPAMFMGLPMFEDRRIIFDRANSQLIISSEG
ncbi:aspartyl protease family protein [Maricaulis sp. MIT060901]|uniref:aspartyl protease family protein n=1 Tax=Maricaulis sp. MIT060901 TaxID=3096993 RepID=UPI00399BEF15